MRSSGRKQYICVTCRIIPEAGRFTAICKELGTASCGKTVDEAITNIKEAIEVDLSALEHHGERARFFKQRGIRLSDQPIKSSKPVKADVGEFVSRQNILLHA
jgi:hypothetical protein